MNVLENIIADMDWRQGELAVLKTLPYRYKMLPEHPGILKKYFIPAIYALWEGFVKNSIQCYIGEINRLQLTVSQLHINILTYALTIDEKLRLENPRTHFDKKVLFVKTYNQILSQPIQISLNVPTKSNVNYEVINDILRTFNLELMPLDFKGRLDKFLKFRNVIAHGDRSIVIRDDDIMEFIQLVIDLMGELYLRVDKGFSSRSYLNEYVRY